jgi:type IV secretory pathway VirJ component
MVRNLLLFLLPFLFSGIFAQQIPADAPFKGLPVVAYPVDTSTCDFLVMVISGDGGWNVWEESLRKDFQKKGIPVAGLDALKYFWKQKTPEKTTSDLTLILGYYLKAWKKSHIILMGYSFGANIVPFAATRFPEPYKSMLTKVVLVSPDTGTDFEIHMLEMLNMDMSEYKYNVTEEVKKIRDVRIICLFGASEDEERKNVFRFAPVQFIELPGSHHFKFNLPPVVDKILEK